MRKCRRMFKKAWRDTLPCGPGDRIVKLQDDIEAAMREEDFVKAINQADPEGKNIFTFQEFVHFMSYFKRRKAKRIRPGIL